MKKINSYRWSRVGWSIVCLLVCAACSHELPEEEGRPAASPVLLLDTRSITVDLSGDPGVEEREEYVKTLRLAAFHGTETCLFNTLLASEQLKAYAAGTVGTREYIKIPLSDLASGVTLPAGELRFYAVANEGVETALSLGGTGEAALRDATVAAKAGGYALPTLETPFLMSAQTTKELLPAAESPGGQTVGIGLERAVAKVELASLMVDGEEVAGYTYTLSATGNVYKNYPLFGNSPRLSEDTQAFAGATGNNAPLYLAEPVDDGELRLSVSVTYDGKTYKAEAVTLPAGKSLSRNTCWQVEGRIVTGSGSEGCLWLDVAVKHWVAVPLNPEYE